MAERAERCDRCRWWQEQTAHDSVDGECRVRSPRVLATSDGSTCYYPTLWPRTRRADWCGEFRPLDPRGFPA